VTAESYPLSGAIVTVTGTGTERESLKASDSVSGNVYTITDLLPGNYHLTVEYYGYKNYTEDIVLSEGVNNVEAPMPVYWQEQDSGISAGGSLYGVYCLNSSTVWALGVNFILHTSDGGTTWTFRNTGIESGSLYSFDFVDSERGWAVGRDSLILYTSDGGITWTQQTNGVPAGSEINSVDFIDSERGWAVGYGSLILYTSNGGNTWTNQGSGIGYGMYAVNFNGVSFVSSTEGWAVGTELSGLNESHGLIYHTTDGGNNWQLQYASSYSEELTGVDFVNSTRGFAFDSWMCCLFGTGNAGTDWNLLSDRTGDISQLGFDFADEQSGWAVGFSPYFIGHTSDGGFTWTKQRITTKGWSPTLYGVHFADASTGWAVGEKYDNVSHVYSPLILKYNP